MTVQPDPPEGLSPAAASSARSSWPLALLHRGRFWVIFEPRDIWVGVFVSPRAVFVCVVPCLALKWERS